ncbi:NCS2 family permease [Methylobacter sp.]|uniref:NCS2 family permease n=1 Tax=Methylobacter sp. TaxID=2051955 RepID=UPI001223D073|nr:NCS2 family permease [Methylobacter sp.]TAK60567.1 MAG: NCS2 family permease [Methylobacter sp.]
MKWFVRADVDGFFGLALDNLVQLLVIVGLCRQVLGFSDDLVYQHILPGAAVSLLVGNLYYAYQAKQLAESSGRNDICALPYGINTVSLFAYIFLVMLPAKLLAEANGAANPEHIAWQAGLLACFGSGLIELGGAFVVERLRKATPRAALLSTLSGIALTFISLGFLFRTYAHPVVGLVTLGVILLVYFGRLRFRGNIPGGLVAVALGVLLSWLMGLAPVGTLPDNDLDLYLPVPVLGDLFEVLTSENNLTYLSVIIPMGLFNLIGSLQNIESAEAAGDSYPTQSSLAVNGIGTIAASLFGSCFPTTIYIGHPGWKAMGARAGYSILNGAFITLICLTGSLSYIAWAIPIDAGMAIVLWIGIVIAAQAFQETPRKHAPAVVMGLLPGIAAWGAFMAKNGVRAADYGTAQMPAFSESMLMRFQQSDIWIHGAFALEQGFIFTAMILAALTVAIIERHFIKAALWSGSASLLSACGLIHSYRWTVSDTALSLTPAWEWSIAYALMGLIFLTAKWICIDD